MEDAMAADRKNGRGGAGPRPDTAPGDEATPGTEGAGENICPACKGSGRVQGGPCPNCGGTGRIVEGIAGG
jgi:RecJ-like exonuclease